MLTEFLISDIPSRIASDLAPCNGDPKIMLKRVLGNIYAHFSTPSINIKANARSIALSGTSLINCDISQQRHPVTRIRDQRRFVLQHSLSGNQSKSKSPSFERLVGGPQRWNIATEISVLILPTDESGGFLIKTTKGLSKALTRHLY